MPDNIIYNEYFYFFIVLALVGIFLLIYRQYFMSNFIKTNAVLSGIKVENSFTRGSGNFYYDSDLYHGVYQFECEPLRPTANGKSSITGTFSGYHISAMISLFIDELHDLQKLCNAMKEVFACPVSIKLCTR